MARIKCKVVTPFVEYVPGEGVIVGNLDEPAEVPESSIDDFVSRDLIKKPGRKPQLDHDKDGEPGGAVPAADDEGQAPA